MMLGLWIILMFGSGMPGLYIYGIVWLVVVDVTDRWYITKMCKQPVRYGQSLPFLLLGEHPTGSIWYVQYPCTSVGSSVSCRRALMRL
jgi:hypothetical protein